MAGMPASRVLVEVAIEHPDDAGRAEEAGAHRLELCSDLRIGGLTPSAGLIQAVRERVEIPLMVLVRPRAGDFCYGPAELEVMLHDVALARRSGADGVVLGALDGDGKVARDATTALVEAAAPLPVTFHRAFDLVPEPSPALETLVGLGVARVLTAGGEDDAATGAEALAALVRQAGNRIAIIAGGGVRGLNVETITARSGVREVHLGPRRLVAETPFGDHWGLDLAELRRVIQVLGR
jgi:copper homeostasis protein